MMVMAVRNGSECVLTPPVQNFLIQFIQLDEKCHCDLIISLDSNKGYHKK